MGQVEFKDFLWEALLDTGSNCTMGKTAENLAQQYGITREEVDKYAERSFARAVAAQESGFLAGEIAAITDEEFTGEGLQPRGIKLPRNAKEVSIDTHIRASTYEALAKNSPRIRRRANWRPTVPLSLTERRRHSSLQAHIYAIIIINHLPNC